MTVRETLDRLIRERGEDYTSISRLLRRNPAYVQQFIRRGVPRKLDEEDRRTLAAFFAVDEAVLGGLSSPLSAPPPAVGGALTRDGLVRVPLLDVLASAGPGGAAIDERAQSWLAVEPRWLRTLGVAPEQVSLIRVQGDSMADTLHDGDSILVDRGDAAERLRDGVYVLRIDEALNVKRIALQPGRRFTILSDNPAYPPVERRRGDRVDIVGRVVWAGRRLS